MSLTFFLFIIVIGLEFGSFANVCIHRWPRNGSVLHPRRSRCVWCKKNIPWYDNIPVISFLLLAGRCRQCRSPISIRYPLVEIFTATLWSGTFILMTRYAVDSNIIFLGTVFTFELILVITTMTDLDWKLIPDTASYGLIIIGLITSPMNPLLDQPAWHRFLQSALGFLAGGGAIFLLGWMGKIVFKKDAMGGGDVKLLGGIGTILGWQGALTTLLIASLAGGIISILGLLLKKLKRHQYIPFGPFLNLGALLTLILMMISPVFITSFFTPF